MKGLKGLFCALALVFFLSVSAYAYDFDTPLVIDGTDFDSAYKGDPRYSGFIANNRTYVPLRFVSEQMDFDVNYTHATRDISITGNGQVVGMNVRSKNFTVNGVKKTMDVAPILYNNRTYVPIRFVGESLKKRVEWNPNDRAVYIGHAVNYRDKNYLNYKKLDFSKYGFELYIPPNFEKNILIVESPEYKTVEFFAKALYKKGTDNGLVGSIGVQEDAAIFPALNTYCEDGKVLARDEFGDHRLKKLDPKLKGSDEALKVFQEAVEIPTTNIFPKFDLKTLDNPPITESKAQPEQTPAPKPADTGYTTFTFGNPKVTIQIPNDLMKELVVKKETEWRLGYWIYDKKTVQMNNRNFGGAIKYYEQFKLEKGEYEMFDELHKKINTKGNIITVEGIPRDAQIDYRNKREADRFNALSERVNREVKVTVAK